MARTRETGRPARRRRRPREAAPRVRADRERTPGTLRAVRLVIPLAVHTAILPSSTVSYPAAGVAGAGWATVSPCRPSPSTTRSSRTSSPRCGTSARTPHLPPPRRRAGHPARLRGHPRRPGRRRHRADPARVGPRRPAREPEAARRADPARRPRDAGRDDAAAADRRGRVPRHDPGRGHPAGPDVRDPAAGRPVRAAVLRPRPDARDRRDARRRHPAARRPRRGRRHGDLPARRPRGPEVPGAGVRRHLGADQGGDRRDRLPPQRPGLHHAGPRRRGGPALRRRV